MNPLKVKVAVQVSERDVPCWPCINHKYHPQLNRLMDVIRQENPDMEFTVYCYTSVEQAKKDYETDVKTYAGVLVLTMTCWTGIDHFYARQARGGLPTIVADVPFCGSGSILILSKTVREENLPVPLLATSDPKEVAQSMALFRVISRMKQARILVVSNRVRTDREEAAQQVWGCSFINMNSGDLNEYYLRTDEAEAAEVVARWKQEADGIIEPTDSDLLESAKLYLAIRQMKHDQHADAITIDCLSLSYGQSYDAHRHMYPCMAFYTLNRCGETAVCEADVNATTAALATLYLTGRSGYVSDPVIDTSSNQIIYCHCVACPKVYGTGNAQTCRFYIRSHAEDQRGASVQVIFPENQQLTTTMFLFPEKLAVIHSSVSVGNVGGDEGCRSKLAATTNADHILKNWQGLWHRVTVFGEYRKLFTELFRMIDLRVVEEDR